MIFFRIATFFSVLLSINQGFSQNNWQHFTRANGLVANSINKVLIQDASNIWLATDSGLSHFDGTNFTNYTILNSTLTNQNVKDLVYVQNKLWLLTDYGIVSFDGTSFTTFTVTSGLLSNDVKGITSTSNGDLWIATLNGVSSYDGTQFTNYTNKVARAIESDTNDNVYILTRTAVVDAAPITIYEVFDGSSWSSPATGRFSGNYQVKFFKSRNGKLFFVGNNQARIAELSYPFNLSERDLTNTASSNSVSPSFITEKDGKIWVTDNNDPFLIGATEDSALVPVMLNNIFSTKATDMDVNDGLTVVGSNNGFFIAGSFIQPVSSSEVMDVNTIRTKVKDYGPLFNNLDNTTASFEIPKDSGSHGIFAANIILAAKHQNNLIVNPWDPYGVENKSGPIHNTSGLGKSFMAKVTKQEIQNHINSYMLPSYVMPEGIANWPANADSSAGMAMDLAPFFDWNRNDCYDPENGDYPQILGDEAIYWINHPSYGLPFEYHWMLYGFNNPNDSALNQTLFLQLRVINRGAVTYDSLKLGFFIDGDIGNPNDDYMGSDSLNNILYFYNGGVFDNDFSNVKGFGSNPPTVGVKFLSDPMVSAMSSGDFLATRIPSTDQEWWNFLNNRWANGNPLKYGRNGYNSTGPNTTHIYTGSPFPLNGWTEVSPGQQPFPNFPGDRSAVGSMPVFSLSPFQSKTVEFAIGYGRKASVSTPLENVPELVHVLNHAKAVWDTLSRISQNYSYSYACFNTPVSLDEQQIENNNLKIFPNPSKGQVFIQSDNSIQAIEVYNINGQLLRSETVQNQLNFSLDFSELNYGLYIIRLQDAKSEWKMRKVMIVK